MRNFTPKRLGVILIVTAIALAINFFGFLLPHQQKLYGPGSAVAIGTIAAKDLGPPVGRNQNRHATVRFRDPRGMLHTVDNEYGQSAWDDLTIGQNVTVHYVTTAPEDARDEKASGGGPPRPWLSALICGVMILAGVGLLMAGRGAATGTGTSDAVFRVSQNSAPAFPVPSTSAARPGNPTVASSPGGVTLSRAKLQRLCPEFGGSGTVARIEDVLNDRGGDISRMADHLQNGDSRAAVVVCVAPLLVSAYTDELDCVALLRFPDIFVRDYQLALGSRLLTVNRYGGGPLARDLENGPASHHRWSNFQPLIADFLSDDRERIAFRKSQITEDEWGMAWSLGQRWMAARGATARDGRPNRSQLPAG
ncbi:MAG: hypothetical protein ABIY70_13585 [Capsulimonas sp.]|uniref:hypothetical protein n=1 Tax=Capsulimonas sp. TaxID=2494211 RepID=UPI003267BD53